MSKQVITNIFQIADFREFLKNWASVKGRGEYTKIAKFLGVQTTLISQIMNNQRCLTEEQAFKLCQYMQLNLTETEYFLKLIQKDRAGTYDLKLFLGQEIKRLQQQAQQIKNRIEHDTQLTSTDLALFYSSWKYAAVRLLTDVVEYQSCEKIAKYLSLSMTETQNILDFLVLKNLCEEKNNRYLRTKSNTHVDSQSPLVVRHHHNWRNKAMSLQEKMSIEDLCFTAPISISNEDQGKVREILLDAISKISSVVKKSEPESIHYLGIDFMKI